MHKQIARDAAAVIPILAPTMKAIGIEFVLRSVTKPGLPIEIHARLNVRIVLVLPKIVFAIARVIDLRHNNLAERAFFHVLDWQ